MHQLPHGKAIVLQRQQFFLSVQVHGLHHCPRRGTSAVLGFRSRCRPGTAPPLSPSLSFSSSFSCLSISCEFVARCDCNCMCRYESFYILHSTFCAPHFIFLSSFSYTSWSENCNLHFFRMPRESGKNVN